MKAPALLLLACCTALPAQDLKRLPDWAQRPAAEGLAAPAPEGADAWVLLDRTEFAYTGDGEIRQRHYRLVRILTERGLDEGRYVLHGLGGRGNKIKRLKGWNCRADGESTKLDQDEVVVLDADGADELTTRTRTVAVLDRVAKGSLVAFESQELLRLPSGPGASAWPLEENPVRTWELAMAKEEGWFRSLKQVRLELQTRNLKPWLGLEELKDVAEVRLRELPALPRHELAVPAGRDVWPRVVVRFQDPLLKDAAPLGSWDAMAGWYAARYSELAQALQLGPAPTGNLVAELKAMHAWIAAQTTYKKVYLSPERGWIPESAAEVRRKRYGDCKDLACLVVAAARGLGLEAQPVLARIMAGLVAADEPVSADAFNHVIAAIKLPASLGLPAEVETPQGRFLLVDPTAPFTPFGRLPETHHLGRVLICLPTGGSWVAVPDQALQRPRLALRLEGQLAASGRLSGFLTVREEGDYLGFRSAAAAGNAKALKEQVAAQFDFPLEASWEAELKSDPRDLEQPLQVAIRLDHPKAFQHLGSDFVLLPLTFPRVPDPIQKAGQPRRYPVERLGFSQWSFEGSLKLPHGGYRPLLPTAQTDTAFRTCSLDSTVQGELWQLHFTQARRDARFGFGQREEGVKAARQDRSQYRRLLDEGLALRFGP